jgi:hypothetical protein
MMRRVIDNSILLLVYLAFVISVGLYLHGCLKYRGVDAWPSVSAEIIGGGGNVVSFPTQTRHGMNTATVDSRFVEFRYSVLGKSYRSKSATPDGGGLPLNPLNRPWRAFYKPSSPDVAVLSPDPYQGNGLLIAAVFSGMLVAVYLWFTPPSIHRLRLLAALSGIAAALLYFHHTDRWAHVEATGEPKFEMPTWWMVDVSVMIGLIVALLMVAIGVGITRIRRARGWDGSGL